MVTTYFDGYMMYPDVFIMKHQEKVPRVAVLRAGSVTPAQFFEIKGSHRVKGQQVLQGKRFLFTSSA